MEDDEIVDDERLDWGTAPEQFRQTFETLGKAHQRLKNDFEKMRRQRASLEAERDEARRQIVFVRAIKPEALDSTAGRMFEQTYDGDLTVEAVSRAWGAVQVDMLTAALDASNGDLHALLGDRR